jgi:hypothetical protein
MLRRRHQACPTTSERPLSVQGFFRLSCRINQLARFDILPPSSTSGVERHAAEPTDRMELMGNLAAQTPNIPTVTIATLPRRLPRWEPYAGISHIRSCVVGAQSSVGCDLVPAPDATASSQPRPKSLSGSKYVPSAHSFQALTKTAVSGSRASTRAWFTAARTHRRKLAGVAPWKAYAFRPRRAVLSQPAMTPL